MARRKKSRRPLDYISIPKLNISPEVSHSIWVVLLLALGVICFLSLFGLAGAVGLYLYQAMNWLSGWGKALIPLLLILAGWQLYNRDRYEIRGINYLGMFLFLWSFEGILQLFVSEKDWDQALQTGSGGGHLGWSLATIMVHLIGFWAGLVFIIALLVIGLLVMFNTSLSTLFEKGSWPARMLAKPFAFLFRPRDRESALAREYDRKMEEEDEMPEEEEDPLEGEVDDSFSLKKVKDAPKTRLKAEPEEKIGWKPTHIKIDLPFDLLNNKVSKPTSGDIKSNTEIIKTTLEKFNIPVEMGEVSVGPTVTQYTLKPEEGIKLSRITGLNNDLSMALAAHPVRIEAPIPGKALVGIEVPNRTVAVVNLRETLESEEFKRRPNNLMIALGKDVAGKVWLDSITKMPHLLVAGATGSGKSVMLNTLIVSLLYQNNPDDLKFIMVDPKRVELTIYNGLPHLLTPVITEVSKTINALKWCLNEMDRRFETLAKVGKRDIEGYNQNAKEKMPYIVFIIDELADLMVVAAKDMETGIVRLAQMARAVGIHLILATQRPSVNVITGTIKANMPARIAFSVASGIDSRTILDSLGAEKLLGRGDMLFSSVALSKPKRIQGALITDQEIRRVVSYIKERSGEPQYLPDIVERQKVKGVAGVGMDGSASDDDDELFNEAKELIINSGKASASYLQRRLSIGYARAARLLDLLEESGVIGPSNGAKAREIMVTKEQYEALVEDSIAGARLHNRETAVAPDHYLGEEEASESEEIDDEEAEDEETDDDAEVENVEPEETPEFMNEADAADVVEENDIEEIVHADEAEAEMEDIKQVKKKHEADDEDMGKYFSR